MKRLKNKQSHGCDWCRQEGTKAPAIYRNVGFSSCSCEAHLPDLLKKERMETNPYQTEAEFQLGI